MILGPEKMIVVPPRHYCIVENPAVKDKDGQVVFDTHGQVSAVFNFRLRFPVVVLCICKIQLFSSSFISSVTTFRKDLCVCSP